MGLGLSKSESQKDNEIEDKVEINKNNNEPIYEYDKYVCNSDTLKETLNKYGIAIIPNVLDKKECDEMFFGTWDFFEYITSDWYSGRIFKNDSESWKNFEYLGAGLSMLHQKYHIGHSQHSWNLRQNPKIVDIFGKFWNCENKELLVSFDGLGFLPPPEITEIGWATDYWFHMDQRFSKPEFDGIQSWITALDVNDKDSTIIFFEKSHLLIRDFLKQYEISEERMHNDWAPFEENELNFYKNKCEMKAIKCPAGSIVIWDSRLVHCGMGPKKDRKNKNFRCVNYLSYSPKNTANDEIQLRKQMGFEKLYTSNHYANRATFFSTNPLNINFKKIPNPKLTKLGLSLVGYNV
jgi:hypothetical protein